MFNINLLGSPGIQPETVDKTISFMTINSADGGKINSKKLPKIVNQIYKLIKDKYDWFSFLLVSILIIIALGPGGKYLGISESHYSKDEILSLNNQTISIIFNAIENLNKEVTLQKFVLNSEELKLKLFSEYQETLFSISNELQSCPDAITRVYGDSSSTYTLTLESPWNIYSDNKDQILPIYIVGDYKYVLSTIYQLMEENNLHQGNLILEKVAENNYQIEFTPGLD